MIVHRICVIALTLMFGCVLALNQMEINALKELNLKWNVSGWKGEPNCSSWSQHLTCNDQMNVIYLDIGFAKPQLLSGKIPDAICNLTYLQQLKLYGNRLSGEIPSCIGKLLDMKYLDLSGNCLGGPIPESLGNLSQMEYFDLSVNHHNAYSFPHRELCNKSLKNNGLIGEIPLSLGAMNKAKYFYLSGNLLTGQIPESLGGLSSAMYIYINANNLTGQVPKSIGKLQNLQDLQLNKNNLSGAIPEEIGNCSSIRIIQMNHNRISGEVPNTIGNLAQLQALELLDNNLQGNIPEFKTTPVLDLNLLDLRKNNLSGALPKSLGDAPLRYLLLTDNKFLTSNTGDLPDYIKPDYATRSIVDDSRHFDCPGFTLFSSVFQVTDPVIQIDPEYYSYSLCNCKPGYFGNPPNGCRECLKGGYCSSNSTMSFDVWKYPTVDDQGEVKGFLDCPYIINYNIKDLPFGSACNPNGSCFYGKKGLSGSDGNCTLCAPGYHGRMCSICSCASRKDCFYHFHNGCVPCKSIQTNTIVLYSIVLVVVLILFAIFHNSSLVRLLLIVILVSLALALDSGSWLYLNVLLVTIVLIPATTNGLSSGLIKSLIFYLQTAVALTTKTYPNISISFAFLTSSLSFSNVNFIGLVCLFPHTLGISQHATVNRYIMSLCAPGIIFALIVVFLLFKQVLFYSCRKAGFNLHEGAALKVQISFSLVFVVYFSFFNASSLVISAFTCSPDPSGFKYMTAQHYESVRCDSIEWWSISRAAIIGAVILIFLPLIAFTILLRKHRSRLDNPDVKSWLGYLYSSYKPIDANRTQSKIRARYWCYFEIAYMFMRFCLAFGLAFCIPETVQGLWASGGVLMLLFMLASIFLKLKPYDRGVENKAAFASIVALTLMHYTSMQTNMHPINMELDDTLLALYLVAVFGVANVGMILMFIVLIIWHGREDIKTNIRSVKTSFVHCWSMLRSCKKDTDMSEPCLQSVEQTM